MATKLERTLGATLAGSYGRGPATGVDYFSDTGRSMGEANVNPGLESLTDDNSAPDAGSRGAIPETFGGMGGGGGGSFDTGGRDVGSFRGVSEADAGRLGAMGLGASMLGIATRDPSLAQFGGAMSAGAQATQSNFGPAGSFIGGMLGGAPGALAGGLAGRALSPGGITAKDAIQTTLGYAVPAYGLANAVTGGKIGDAFFGTDAGLAAGGTMTAPAQPGFFGSLGVQNIGRTVDSRGMPTSGTQVGQVAGPAGYSFSSVTSPTGLAGQMGQVVASPTGFNMTTAPGFDVNSVLGAPSPAPAPSAPMGGGQTGGSSWGGYSSPGAQSAAQSRQAAESRAVASSLGGGKGGYGGGKNSDGSSGPGDSSGRSSGGGMGADGWADGGMIGQDTPGIPTSYAGGQTPMLAQGYNDGGEVAAGMPGMPQQMMGAQPNPQQVNTQINQMLRDPQVRQQMVMRAQQLMQTGELTPQEVMTMAQVAEAALYNPSLYPQLRQFVMEQGMSPLPPAFDPNVVMKIIAVSRALQQAQPATPPGQVPPTDQAQMQPAVPGMGGGHLQGPGTGRSDSIGTVNESTGEPVKVANGEYVIPAHVVKAKGREFFDNLLRRYADLPKGEAS